MRPDARRAALAAALVALAATGTVEIGGRADEPAPGRTYYADAAEGSDESDGASPSRAWRTLDRVGRAALRPGDAVLLRRGSSWTSGLRLAASGTAAAPITVDAFGTGPPPTIRTGDCVTLAGDHVVLRGLRLDRCAWAGITVSGSHNRVEGTVVTGNVSGVYVKRGAVGNAVVGNQVLANDRMSVLTREPAGDDSGAFGILVHGDANEIAHNVITGSDAFSWDYGRDGAAVEVYGGRRNVIHHNLAVDNNMFSELGDPRTADTVYAYNVVRSSRPGGGFLTTRGARSRYGPVVGTRLYHNTVALSGADSQGIVCHAGCGPEILTMRNNIVQAVRKAAYADAPFDESHNLFWGGSVELEPAASSVRADPGFVDVDEGDLRLRPSSPAVDSGADSPFDRDFDGVVLPVDGDGDGRARPDRGAFERSAGEDHQRVGESAFGPFQAKGK